MKNYRIKEVTFRVNIIEFIPERLKDTLLTRLFLRKKAWQSIACENFRKHNRGYKTYEQALERINEDRMVMKQIRRTKLIIHNI